MLLLFGDSVPIADDLSSAGTCIILYMPVSSCFIIVLMCADDVFSADICLFNPVFHKQCS